MTTPALQLLPLATPSAPAVWVKTPDDNIYIHVATGGRYLKATVCGKSFVRSLKTKSQETAKRRRDAMLVAERKRRDRCTDESVTMGKLMEDFEVAIAADGKLKPRSKDYRMETLRQLKATWPELQGEKPGDVTRASVKEWADKVKQQYSPTRFNGTLETLRRLLGMAKQAGLLGSDPADTIDRASVPLTQEELPDLKDIQRLVEELDRPPGLRKQRAAKVIKFMLYTGCRIGATPEVMRSNIDLERNEIVLPKIKYDDKPVRVPIFGEARPFFERLLAEHEGDGPLFTVRYPAKVLAAACRAIGIPRLTLHKLVKIFSTVAFVATKDAALVAQWRGHKDRGVTLLKTYVHLMDSYSQAEAKKVRFSPTIDPAPANQNAS